MSLNESADTPLFDGREFSSFEELSHDISEYEKRFFVNPYVRSSRSIESAKRRTPNKAFSEDLKFSEVDFSCKEGGRKGESDQIKGKSCVNTRFSCLVCISNCAFLNCLSD